MALLVALGLAPAAARGQIRPTADELARELERLYAAERWGQARAVLERTDAQVVDACMRCLVLGAEIGWKLRDYAGANVWAVRALGQSRTSDETLDALRLLERFPGIGAPSLSAQDKERILGLAVARREPGDHRPVELLMRHLVRFGEPDKLVELVGEHLAGAAETRPLVCLASGRRPDTLREAINLRLLDLGWTGPFLPAGEVAAPQIVYRGELDWPEELRDPEVRRRLVRTVPVVVVVEPSGEVSRVFLSDTVRPPLLEAVEAHARGWLFEPGMLSAEPVAVCHHETIDLRLDSPRPLFATKYADALAGLRGIVESSGDDVVTDEARALIEPFEVNSSVKTDPALVDRATALFLSALSLAHADRRIFAGLFELLSLGGRPDEIAEVARAELLDASLEARSTICAAHSEGSSEELRDALNERLSELGWPGPYLQGSGPSRPKMVEGGSVHYNEEARKARLTGYVLVRSVIDELGHPGSLTVLNEPPEILEEIAIGALREWRFEPATLGGRIVAACFNKTVTFELQ